ncbi:hypothetical protein EGJ86_19325 [Pseudomonas sp. o96-267]|uniref:hypothetical protein n=1 Tax=Pseudomonas sp. o96-267 TaxID=2479853 RepID=UPI000F76F0B7|nr:MULTISPECIES: hypothetical protein [Pseudomonas]MDH0959080.1 hypothetical protein [Pseudomonas chengduensis]MDV5863612.1 hypothetical protein [Pseudomonas mendocina]RRV31724.1 hypothetical protein EGJ86_19325 [Pseudomonas sp. o96-267]
MYTEKMLTEGAVDADDVVAAVEAVQERHPYINAWNACKHAQVEFAAYKAARIEVYGLAG